MTEEQRERLDRLAAAPDDEIDTTDIPEVTDWSGAIRGGFSTLRQQAAMVAIDPDVLAWFKDHADGRDYQRDINRVLRQHLAAQIGAGK